MASTQKPSSTCWLPPKTATADASASPVLKIYNSLTRNKDAFVPIKSGLVTWYNCGPTVYDDCHMGHARNYVTQDVIRRILRDYFGYRIHFVMNITDIDDKIILRARQTYLLQRFTKEHTALSPELRETIQAAWDAYFQSSISKLLYPDTESPSKLSGESWTSLLAKLKQDPQYLETLRQKSQKFTMHLQALTSSRSALTSATDPHSLIQSSEAVLAPYLDSKKGSSLNDPAIFRALPAEMEASFFRDMAALNIERPTVLTRVTEYVPEIVHFVQKIMDNGYAYRDSTGSVYFDVKAFDHSPIRNSDIEHIYAKLQPWSKGDASLLEEGEGALSAPASGKRSAADFALWKSSKPGEPAWDSPWGAGRPGWHIECSVMASSILGSQMDIHSGGIDLAFPHHDNELAQSEAFHNCPQWVNYFIHTGHLHIEGLKMSKSLKNFITIKEALQKYTPRQLRLSFLLQPWHGRMDFKESALVEVRAKESLFSNFFVNTKAIIRKVEGDRQLDGQHHFSQAESSLFSTLHSSQATFHEALCDSFDTPRAIEVLSSLVTSANTYINSQNIKNTSALFAVAEWVTKMLRVFGLVQSSDGLIGWGDAVAASGAVDRDAILMPYLNALSKFRDEVRRIGKTNRDIMALCDNLRDEDLVELGVALDDQPDGTALVKLVPKEDLLRAREDKRAAQEAKQAKAEEKRQAQEAAARQKEIELAKELELGKIPPREWFKGQTDKFSDWDSEGFPLKDASGEAIGKSAQKKLKKELEAQIKRHDKYLKSQTNGTLT